MPINRDSTLAVPIIKSITQGNLDADLKDIARACYERAQELGVAPTPEIKPKQLKKLAKRPGTVPASKQDQEKPVLATDYKPSSYPGKGQYQATRADAKKGTHTFNGKPIRIADLITGPVSPVEQGYVGAVVRIEGVDYPKNQLLGHYFYLPPGTYGSSTYDWALVRITGAGQKSLKVEFEKNRGGNATAFDDSAFINHKRVSHLYGSK